MHSKRINFHPPIIVNVVTFVLESVVRLCKISTVNILYCTTILVSLALFGIDHNSRCNIWLVNGFVSSSHPSSRIYNNNNNNNNNQVLTSMKGILSLRQRRSSFVLVPSTTRHPNNVNNNPSTFLFNSYQYSSLSSSSSPHCQYNQQYSQPPNNRQNIYSNLQQLQQQQRLITSSTSLFLSPSSSAAAEKRDSNNVKVKKRKPATVTTTRRTQTTTTTTTTTQPPIVSSSSSSSTATSTAIAKKEKAKKAILMIDNNSTPKKTLVDSSNVEETSITSAGTTGTVQSDTKIYNLSTIELNELETLVVTILKQPKYRVQQIWSWIREKKVTDPNLMSNIPDILKKDLIKYTKEYNLQLVYEIISKADGTIKRAYECYDGQLIESVLMPYNDGRYTACISSQAGCAQGCIFCATGQMGLARQLTADEIYEQVVRFITHLHNNEPNETSDNNSNKKPKRLSNIVFMGMGEPLANYRNVGIAIRRITSELGIGARKITVSTVGIVPNIRKLIYDTTIPPVRLAVSLHCSNDIERSTLLPANDKYGGLYNLMNVLNEYITITGQRITFEWALIDNTNDSVDVAHQLGKLITQGITTTTKRKYRLMNNGDTDYKYRVDDDDIIELIVPKLRRDMVHINVIPLNPTSQYSGSPSQRLRVDTFINVLQNTYNIACTPRVRRGIDIDAGCGQLKSKVLLLKENSKQQEQQEQQEAELQEIEAEPVVSGQQLQVQPGGGGAFTVGIYDDDDDDDDDDGTVGGGTLFSSASSSSTTINCEQSIPGSISNSVATVLEQQQIDIKPLTISSSSTKTVFSLDETTLSFDYDDEHVSAPGIDFDTLNENDSTLYFDTNEMEYNDDDDDCDDGESFMIQEYESVMDEEFDDAEAQRLLALIQGTTIDLSKL